MKSQEIKRTPNKPPLLGTTKKSPSSKNINKSTRNFSPTQNNMKKSSSDVHFNNISLYSSDDKLKTDDTRNRPINNPYSNTYRQKIPSSPKRNQPNEKLSSTNHETFTENDVTRSDLFSNYSQDQLTEDHQQNENEYTDITSNDNLSNSDNFDAILGNKIRKIFNQKSDNDNIVHDIKILIQFLDSIKPETNTSNISYDIQSSIKNLSQKIHENDELKAKIKELTFKYNNSEDKNICQLVKSFYNNCEDRKQILFLLEKDLTFSMQIRNIFNQTDNYEAIIRTIQSNKETADDNKVLSELSVQIQHLNENTEINKKIYLESDLIQKIKDQHQEELNEKDSQIDDLNRTINDLKNQIENLNETIEKKSIEIKKIQNELFEEKKKFENEMIHFELLKDQNINESFEKMNHIKQFHETQINKLKEEITENQIYIQKLINENSEKNQKIILKEEEIEQIKTQIIEDQKIYQHSLDDLHNKENDIIKFKNELESKEKLLNQLRSEVFDKQRINEEKIKEINELRIFIKNSEDIKDKEISYLQKELLSSLEKQKKVEIQLNKMIKKYEDTQNKSMK